MHMCMYLLFMHNQEGRLYIHTYTRQVLCVLLWSLYGFTPSVLTPNLRFLGSAAKLASTPSNALHWLASEGCVRTAFSHRFGSFNTTFFLSACHRRAWLPCSPRNTVANGE